MNTLAVREEVLPAWTKAVLIGMAALAILVTLPWIFMWTTMAATCFPMMDSMNEMMRPGMMR